MQEYLKKITKNLKIEITDQIVDQFCTYYHHLIEKNKVINLTTITEKTDIAVKHFLDSIMITDYYTFEDNSSIIDVGTGAGFPGIPLAIVLPRVQFVLMDSLNKRVKFLEEVVQQCNLKNVSVVHARAEDLGRNELYREKFDVCVSRAVANLSVLLEYCTPFVKKGGVFFSYKSVQVEEELNKCKNAQKELCLSLNNKIEFILPESDYQRSIIVFNKIDSVGKKYPRQAGIPKKKPL